MEAKDKAKELVDKYNKDEELFYLLTIGQSKQCALIAVDEILDSNMIHLHLHQMDYWQEVKQEINKL